MIPQIYFEDVHLIVFSKPVGLLSQGEHTGDANVVDWLRERWGRPYVGLVHRLDRNTSGLMVVAKRTKSARRLTEELQNGELQRWYQAWVWGEVPDSGRWEHHLLKDERLNRTQIHPQGKLSTLEFKRLELRVLDEHPQSLVEFHLQSGRSHQIRVQSSHEGFPLVGDRKYGAQWLSREGKQRPLLHSYRLKFKHPMSQEWMEYVDPLPPDMK